jgi:hypothetical protein
MEVFDIVVEIIQEDHISSSILDDIFKETGFVLPPVIDDLKIYFEMAMLYINFVKNGVIS